MNFLYLLSFAFLSLPAVGSISLEPVLATNGFVDFVHNLLSEWTTPGGLGVALVRQNKGEPSDWLIETGGFGNATRLGERVSPQTQFAIASNSKLFAVLTVGMALEHQKVKYPLGWKTKICSLLPAWCTLHERVQYPLYTEDHLRDLEYVSKEATIEDLMTHRTGWPRHEGSYQYSMDVNDILSNYLPNLKRSASFRETWQYNNIPYSILAEIASVIWNTGEPFVRLVEKHIFQPLGMEHTTYEYRLARDDALADGFTRLVQLPRPSSGSRAGLPKNAWVSFTKGEAKTWPFWDQSENPEKDIEAGPGGIIMSMEDSATWLQTLLLNGKHPKTGVQVIPANVVEKAATGLAVALPKGRYPELSPTVYGGGQQMSSYRGHTFIEHGGSVPGFLTQIIRFPDQGFGVAVFSNDDVVGQVLHDTVKWWIVDTVLGLERIDWNTRMKESKTQFLSDRSPRTPRPASPNFPSSLSVLEGHYANPSYGKILLCLVLSTFPPCKSLVSSVDVLLPGVFPSNSDVPSMVFAKDNVWISHVKLTHFDGALWNASTWRSVEDVAIQGKRWPVRPLGEASEDGFVAEFEFEEQREESQRPISMITSHVKGFGLRGVWGAGPGVGSPVGETIVERSEVWFVRM
ncbi:beta-lactamase/transpeptidase-like protein [Flagelloscypha sp. PMI_526]|nr:beta-lactamase/transpeptidase-like protein [Flagelloscypha sp. PMI_526]